MPLDRDLVNTSVLFAENLAWIQSISHSTNPSWLACLHFYVTICEGLIKRWRINLGSIVISGCSLGPIPSQDAYALSFLISRFHIPDNVFLAKWETALSASLLENLEVDCKFLILCKAQRGLFASINQNANLLGIKHQLPTCCLDPNRYCELALRLCASFSDCRSSSWNGILPCKSLPAVRLAV